MLTCKITLPDSPHRVIISKNPGFRALYLARQNEFRFFRLINTKIHIFSFLAAGFCPKNLAFARKIVVLPESWGLQPPSLPGSYAYAGRAFSLRCLSFLYVSVCSANVDLLLISNDENVTSFMDTDSFWTAPSSLVFIEGRPGLLRCIAVGGQPPPALTVQLLPPVVSGLPVRRLDLAESWWVTVGGRRGLRVVRRVTERGTATFRAATHDDGAEVRCSAAVNGLPPRTTSVQVVVHCTFFSSSSSSFSSSIDMEKFTYKMLQSFFLFTK